MRPDLPKRVIQGCVLVLLVMLAACQTGAGDRLAQPGAGATSPALKLVHQSAREGNLKAQVYLGALYASGDGVAVDYARARYWEEKAAEQGDAKSQYNLGVLYARGLGTPQDLPRAVYWFRKAADQGLAEAQLHMGLMREKGWGIHRCPYAASAWYFRAGESFLEKNNVAMAQRALAAIKRLLPNYYLANELSDEIFMYTP
jgi:TPR repeat protein